MPQRVAAIIRITEEKIWASLENLSTQTESQLLMEFDSINSPNTKKETTEQAEQWHIYT
jgi:hypothetical protein